MEGAEGAELRPEECARKAGSAVRRVRSMCTRRRVWAGRRAWRGGMGVELLLREIRVLHPDPPQPKLGPNLTLT